jgi:hypothetical protein
MFEKYPNIINWKNWTFEKATPVNRFDSCFVYEFSGNSTFLQITMNIAKKPRSKLHNENVTIVIDSIFLKETLVIEACNIKFALEYLDLEMQKVAKTFGVFLKFIDWEMVDFLTKKE